MSTADSPPKKPPIRSDWISKTLAGQLLGLALALLASALFSDLTRTSLALSPRGQLAMWMVAPLWLGIAGGVYFFRSGLQAWLWLGGATLLSAAALLALRA